MDTQKRLLDEGLSTRPDVLPRVSVRTGKKPEKYFSVLNTSRTRTGPLVRSHRTLLGVGFVKSVTASLCD